jgi:hypothetical protein
MSGAERRWPVWKLAVLLYPFASAAVAINLFLLALMGHAVGLPALTPLAALGASVFLGVPAAWAAGRWVRRLIDRAEAE